MPYDSLIFQEYFSGLVLRLSSLVSRVFNLIKNKIKML